MFLPNVAIDLIKSPHRVITQKINIDIIAATSDLKMEAVCSSEMLVSTYKQTVYHVPQIQHQHHHLRVNFKPHADLLPTFIVIVLHSGDESMMMVMILPVL
jgi:hypothetical protein